jgi:hypothetical protein
MKKTKIHLEKYIPPPVIPIQPMNLDDDDDPVNSVLPTLAE